MKRMLTPLFFVFCSATVLAESATPCGALNIACKKCRAGFEEIYGENKDYSEVCHNSIATLQCLNDHGDEVESYEDAVRIANRCEAEDTEE